MPRERASRQHKIKQTFLKMQKMTTASLNGNRSILSLNDKSACH